MKTSLGSPLFVLALVTSALVLSACPLDGDDDDDAGLAILGGGTHDLSGLELTVIADSGDDLDTPRDLAFDPENPDELYVVNRATNSVTILTDPGGDMDAENYNSFGSDHFLVQPSSIAFGEEGDFATIHETDDPTQGIMTPADFMGPVLWSTDFFDGGHASHMDMLHNSPNGMGIAWQEDRVFWVFDGYHDSITRYDFNDDHGPGGTDHEDGEITRYVEDDVEWEEDIPSHMEFDHDADLLYIADTGNNRIAVLDANSGSEGGTIGPNYDLLSVMNEVDGADIWTLAAGEDFNMSKPSGLTIRDGVVYTTDNRRGTILGFSMETGELLDWVDLEVGEGALMGITFDEAGDLWIADGLDDRVFRLSVATE